MAFKIFTLSISIISLLISCNNTENQNSNPDIINKEYKQPFPSDKWTELRSNFKPFDDKEYIKSLEKVGEFNQKHKVSKKSSGLTDLNGTWTSEGPGNIGGRFNTLAVPNDNPSVIYAGAANGGIFKTNDGGVNWQPIFDDFAHFAISSIEIDPNNSNIVYVGTGDRNFGSNSHLGNGIYKSTNAGITWSNSGLEEPSIVSDIIIDPNNSDVIYASTLGNVYEKNNHRGVYKSTNGGTTWGNILFVSDSSGVIDLVMDTSNTSTLYASVMNRTRTQYTSSVTGPDVGIYKTTDSGLTWTKLTNGLPNGLISRIGLAISNNDPNTLYASYTDSTLDIQDIYKTNDAGLNWTALDVHNAGLPTEVQGNFGWYFGEVYLNPYNNDQLIIPGVDMWTTTDLGNSWYSNVPPWYSYEVHADKHAIHFIDSLSYIIATDGGLYKTNDNGITWEDIENIPVTQFYHIATNINAPGIYAGGAQDNGTMEGNSINPNSWTRLFGGDGFRITYLEEEPDAKYVETQNGGLYHLDEFDSPTNIRPSINDSFYVDWDMPYMINESTEELFIAGNKVLMMNSAPFGTYDTISNDLTKVATGSYIGSKRRHVVLELAQPKTDDNTIFAGTSDGLVWRGERISGNWEWTNVSQNLPNRMVSALRISPNDPQTIFVGFSGYRFNDSESYLYKSTDNGITWVDISGDLPNIIVNDILSINNISSDSLFVALDGGVYFTENGGENWNPVGTNLPLLTMSEFAIDYVNERLILGTYSRSMYSYDLDWLFDDTPPISLTENQLEVSIYPNPTKDILHIPNGVFQTIEIFNIQGQRVWKENISKTQSTIDINQLSQGTYYLKGGQFTKKIIKT